MNRTFNKLARWLADPHRWIGFVIFALVWLVGAYGIAWLLPEGGAGAEFGFFLFVFLTGAAAERARSVRSWSFLAWFLAGLVLSVSVGVALSSA